MGNADPKLLDLLLQVRVLALLLVQILNEATHEPVHPPNEQLGAKACQLIQLVIRQPNLPVRNEILHVLSRLHQAAIKNPLDHLDFIDVVQTENQH